MLKPTAILAALLACGCGPAVTEPGHSMNDAGQDDATATPESDATPEVSYVMWAHSSETLFSIDPDTFALTIIGPFDLEGVALTDLAVTPDGTLYGISQTELFRLDPLTGAATRLVSVPGKSNVGMTFLDDGSLLATDKDGGVRRIDPATGAVVEIGVLGAGYSTAGDLVAVADGTMYAIADDGPGCSHENNCLVTVNTATGVATEIGAIGFGEVFGAAYANGHVYAFTNAGELVEIDRNTGAGTKVASYPLSFWGAGVTPLVPAIE